MRNEAVADVSPLLVELSGRFELLLDKDMLTMWFKSMLDYLTHSSSRSR
jgi:hypothetical protein